MPTELTVSPFRIYQQLPIALEHPVPFDKIWGGSKPAPAHHYATGRVPSSVENMGMGMGMGIGMQHPSMGLGGMGSMLPQGPMTITSGMPSTGPARMAECMPNKSMPSGMKNPWAGYSGETYVPNSQKVAAIDYNRAMSGYGQSGSPGMAMPVSIPAPNAGGSISGWAQQSPGQPIMPLQPQVQRQGSFSQPGPANVHLGQTAPGGWNVRARQGHHPDPAATGRRSSIDVNAFGHSPSHPLNHVGLTPGLDRARSVSFSSRPRRMSESSDQGHSGIVRRPSMSSRHYSDAWADEDRTRGSGSRSRRGSNCESCCR